MLMKYNILVASNEQSAAELSNFIVQKKGNLNNSLPVQLQNGKKRKNGKNSFETKVTLSH